jgi:prepilin-type N-terminal cleavage/methylation domain-containing protein
MRLHASKAGFTLIELLVSLALFSIIVMISIGTLLSLVDANRQAQSLTSISNNLNFALDTMARSIGTGYDYYCGSGTVGSGWSSGSTRDCAANEANQWLRFIDDDGDTVTYYAQGGALWRIKNSTTQRLTAPEITIDAAGFFVTGTARGSDTVQPTVTILIQATAGPDPDTSTQFNVQTTVAQRILDL